METALLVTTLRNEADACEIAITKAEQAIQKVLHGLEHDTMMTVWNVAVDTRNFSQLRTEIFLTKAPRA